MPNHAFDLSELVFPVVVEFCAGPCSAAEPKRQHPVARPQQTFTGRAFTPLPGKFLPGSGFGMAGIRKD